MNTLFADSLGMDFKDNALINTGLKNHRLKVEFYTKQLDRVVCEISTILKNGVPNTSLNIDAFSASMGWYLFPYWLFTKRNTNVVSSPDSVLEFINDISFVKYDKLVID